MMPYNVNAANIATMTEVDDLTRARKIAAAWEAYYGKQAKPLKNKPGQPDDNTCINLARLTVDTSSFFLFGNPVTFEIADDEQDTTGNDDSGAETDADVWLENVWKANRQQTFLLKVALNGGVSGHAFVKLSPAGAGERYPRLINLDPAAMRVDWMPDDIEQVYRYTYQYTANDPVTRRARVYRQTTERAGAGWVVVDAESDPDISRWVETGRAVWPYAWPPILDCQNLPAPNEFWGVSDLETDVQELGAAINFNLSNTSRIIRYHAHPKTLGKGFDARTLVTGPDEITVIPTTDGDIWNLEMASDLAASMEHYRNLKAAYHETTQVPEVTTGKFDNIGQLSGLAIQLLYGPIVQRTAVKRLLYGDMLTELNRRLLALGGFGEENDVTTHWPEMLPSDPQGEAQTLEAHQRMGVVSTETVGRKLGYDPETEGPKIAAEKAATSDASVMDAAGGIQQDVPPSF